MNLLQEKLDVVQKKRSNLFNWRGQFTPDFVGYMLDCFTQKGDLVIDPFSGSGTLLQEAILKNRAAESYEINPAAYAMSKFFTLAHYAMPIRWDIIGPLEAKIYQAIQTLNGQMIFIESDDYRKAYSNLIEIAQKLIPNLSDHEKTL